MVFVEKRVHMLFLPSSALSAIRPHGGLLRPDEQHQPFFRYLLIILVIYPHMEGHHALPVVLLRRLSSAMNLQYIVSWKRTGS